MRKALDPVYKDVASRVGQPLIDESSRRRGARPTRTKQRLASRGAKLRRPPGGRRSINDRANGNRRVGPPSVRRRLTFRGSHVSSHPRPLEEI